MTLESELSALRQRLQQMAAAADPEFLGRYAFRYPPPERSSMYRRVRAAVGRSLRELGLRTPRPLEPWLPGLRHFAGSDDARPLVIWAIGADRDALRAACRRLEAVQEALSDRVPVLITDVADFAFFSRLGWLVEYVPKLASPADGYAERKQRYLAWRYRDAAVLPLSALRDEVTVQEWQLG